MILQSIISRQDTDNPQYLLLYANPDDLYR